MMAIRADGIDGWRLDVAFCVKHQFWKDWRKHVKSINPDAYLTAEVVDPVDEVRPYLQGDEFDAVMNYNYLFTCSEYFIDEKKAISTTEFDRLLKELREAFPETVAYVQQNLDNSHDTQRLLSHIVNKDKYHRCGTGQRHLINGKAQILNTIPGNPMMT
jgi:cyclomaltodextrinase / maltogenic alpha-amylase / neopullulanase